MKAWALIIMGGLGLLAVILMAYGASGYFPNQKSLLDRHSGKSKYGWRRPR